MLDNNFDKKHGKVLVLTAAGEGKRVAEIYYTTTVPAR